MNILDDRRVALLGDDHVHLHLQRTLLPYMLFIYSFDDVFPSVLFSSASWKWHLTASVASFTRYALAEIDIEDAFEKSIIMDYTSYNLY